MNLDTTARGRVVFIGWEEADPEMGHERRFIAKVTFDDGAPNWPMGVVFGQVPVTLALDVAKQGSDVTHNIVGKTTGENF